MKLKENPTAKSRPVCHDCPSKTLAKPQDKALFKQKRFHLAAAALLVSSHYIKMVELSELVHFSKDVVRFMLDILGRK